MEREKFENRKKERSDEERRQQEQSRRSRAPTTIEKKKKRSKIESYCFHTELYRTTCSFHLMLTVSSNCINVPSSPPPKYNSLQLQLMNKSETFQFYSKKCINRRENIYSTVIYCFSPFGIGCCILSLSLHLHRIFFCFSLTSYVYFLAIVVCLLLTIGFFV